MALTGQGFELTTGFGFDAAILQSVQYPQGLPLQVQPAVDQAMAARYGGGQLRLERAIERHIEDTGKAWNCLKFQDFGFDVFR